MNGETYIVSSVEDTRIGQTKHNFFNRKSSQFVTERFKFYNVILFYSKI